MRVQIGLKSKGFDRCWVECHPPVVLLDVVLASVLASVVGLKSRREHPEVFGEL